MSNGEARVDNPRIYSTVQKSTRSSKTAHSFSTVKRFNLFLFISTNLGTQHNKHTSLLSREAAADCNVGDLS